MATSTEFRSWVSDPATCTWVAASAGTGKTKVLTDRVLSLLLHGAAPEKILCLTFTRAAAGEMTNRLHACLSRWSTLEDALLRDEIAPLIGSVVTADVLAHARSLFARVLDAKGGMKIMTIHGFCQALLKRFPLEAELPPHFSVLDAQTTQALLHQAQREVLLRQNDPEQQKALKDLAEIFDEKSFAAILYQLLAKRHHFKLEPEGHISGLFEPLLQVSLSEEELDILNRFCHSTHFDEVSLKHAVRFLSEGEKSDKERAQGIASWLFTPEQRRERMQEYCSLFLTQRGEVRKRLVTARLSKMCPELLGILTQEAHRFIDLDQQLKKHRVGRISAASLSLGSAIVGRYEALKRYRGVLDYDDLIRSTGQLLSKPEIAPWVLYKLDGGLDHILVDEAQDTSAAQWRVISALAEEFFSGQGTRPETPRSIFVVGDVKQSIYSFQGADPQVFGQMRMHFSKLVKACQQPWQEVSLTTSYRSTAAVLQVIDQVFQSEIARNGVSMDGGEIKHVPHRQGQAGLVEVWPLIQPEPEETEKSWPMPVVKTEHRPNPAHVLANQLADSIQRWLQNGERLESKNRVLRPRDVMVLVQRRTAFVDALIKALKQRNVPVAGNDRLLLTTHLAIQDLMALGQFLLLPEDDLTLATVLKSPLIGLSEDLLFDLAYDRGDQSLWQQLQELRRDNSDFQRAYAYLCKLKSKVQQLTPYQLYAEILGAKKGKHAFISRLGFDAIDPLQEFLALALAYEQNNTACLQNFLSWLQEGTLEIKRDLDQGGQDEVRIMTVHGSKGLQAPIVILPDTVRVPKLRDVLLWHQTTKESQIPFWNPPREAVCNVTEPMKERARGRLLREYNRLLYVAMTRAEDRLYVCGWQMQRQPLECCWYTQIQQAVAEVGEEAESGWRVACEQTNDQPTVQDNSILLPATVELLPKWADQPIEAHSIEQLHQPSQMQESETERPIVSPLEPKVTSKKLRGEILHKLLQYIPDVEDAKRKSVCRHYLQQHFSEHESDIDPVIQTVLQILADKAFAAVFGPGSQAEVPIIGQTKSGMVSGQIDRLVITPEQVLIVDFKSDLKIPETETQISQKYLTQLRVYAECLAGMYPQHQIRCALLWTALPRLDVVPDQLLQLKAA